MRTGKMTRFIPKLTSCVFAAICCTFLSQHCQAQVVQLPVVHNFSYTGGAIVPDAGTAYLGGNMHSGSGSVSRGGGPWNQNRAFGSTTGASHMSASVQVIDLAAMDEAILNANVPAKVIANNNRTLPVSEQAAADQARKFLTNYSKMNTAREGDPSYRNLNPAQGLAKPEAVDPSLAEANVRYYLKMGQEAETAHRIQSARVYYKMAVEAMTPELMERYQRVLEQREKAEKEKAKAAKDAARKQF